MFKAFMRSALFAVVLLPSLAAGEPITLKLSFFTSDQSATYLSAVKPSPGASVKRPPRKRVGFGYPLRRF